jgi:hypothetical protein
MDKNLDEDTPFPPKGMMLKCKALEILKDCPFGKYFHHSNLAIDVSPPPIVAPSNFSSLEIVNSLVMSPCIRSSEVIPFPIDKEA